MGNGANRVVINGEVNITRVTNSSGARKVPTRMEATITKVHSNTKISMVIKLTINGASINKRINSTININRSKTNSNNSNSSNNNSNSNNSNNNSSSTNKTRNK